MCIHPTIPIWLAPTNQTIQLNLISYTNPTPPNFVNKLVQIEKNVIFEKFVATQFIGHTKVKKTCFSIYINMVEATKKGSKLLVESIDQIMPQVCILRRNKPKSQHYV
jgi:hypothetical protein